jgi:hypothetical protein
MSEMIQPSSKRYSFSYHSDDESIRILRDGVVITILVGRNVRQTLMAFLAVDDDDLQTLLSRFDHNDMR